jgi:beta-lactamase class A
MKIRITYFLLIFCLDATAQISSLKSNIEQLCKLKKATIGVALYDFQTGDTLSIHGDTHFPMQSVFKLHIALALMDEVEKGKLSLDKKIEITQKELLPNTWSPLRDDYPAGVSLTLETILSYMISKSDNNACDILLRQLGGVAVVNKYIHTLNMNDFSIRANEEEMSKDWNTQFLNWTTPKAATGLLEWISAAQEISASKNYDLLVDMMIKTLTGPNRLKKGLPPNAIIAHRTGTSDTNKEGITAAVNDIGIVELPIGKRFAISVFVSNSRENMETNEKVIADIAKLVADYFSK